MFSQVSGVFPCEAASRLWLDLNYSRSIIFIAMEGVGRSLGQDIAYQSTAQQDFEKAVQI